jgi:hypothetical protein
MDASAHACVADEACVKVLICVYACAHVLAPEFGRRVIAPEPHTHTHGHYTAPALVIRTPRLSRRVRTTKASLL